MKYLSDNVWDRLPLTDFRSRFFIEAYSEKLHMQTPHFQQARLMNLFSCCSEALIYIADQRVSDKSGGYLHLALDEIESCLSLDPIAKQMFEAHEKIIKDLLKTIRGGTVGPSQLARLEIIAELILSRRNEYEDSLLAALRDAVVGDRDLDKKDRLLQEIYSLTGLYVTTLLDQGFSPKYLYNRAEMFTRPSNYGARSFPEQFDSVTEKLRSRRETFRVHFSMHTNKISSLLALEQASGLSLIKGVPEEVAGKELDKLKRDFFPSLVATVGIESTDYVRAAWLGKEKLNEFLDFASALEVNPSISVASHCVIVWDKEELTHKKSLNLDLLTRFMVSEAGTYLTSSHMSLHDVFDLLDEAGKQNLQRSLRYLRLARESISIDQRLLNLWIAFESLFDHTPHGLLQAINEMVPQIYAIMALRRRVAYLRDLLGSNGIVVTPRARDEVMDGAIRFSRDISEEAIFKMIRDEASAIELFESLGQKEHLKFILKTTCDTFRDSSAIRHRVKLSESDVARQIRRIYFLRNKMAHSGYFANTRPQLVIHLVDYLTSCYIAISQAARHRKGSGGASMEACLQAYKMGSEQVLHFCEEVRVVERLKDLTPVPVI